MKDEVSGFEVRGSWREVVQHGRRITDALRELLAGDDPFRVAFQEWEDWRPKIGDSLEGEMSRKTSRLAAVDEGEGERAGRTPRDDLHSAGGKLRGSVSDLEENGVGPAAEGIGESLRYASRAADSLGRKILRTLERTVYEKIMTRVSPYYFDNDLVSANIHRGRNGSDDFVFEVNINEDDLKTAVGRRLDDDQAAETEPVDEAEGSDESGPGPHLRSLLR